jgi:hypothetical protein
MADIVVMECRVKGAGHTRPGAMEVASGAAHKCTETPLKRARPICSSAVATPEANLPRDLARNNDRDCSMGKHEEQAMTCEVAVRCSGGGAPRAARSGQSEVPRALRPVTCRAHAQRRRDASSPPRPSICHSPPETGPLTKTAYTRARAPM